MSSNDLELITTSTYTQTKKNIDDCFFIDSAKRRCYYIYMNGATNKAGESNMKTTTFGFTSAQKNTIREFYHDALRDTGLVELATEAYGDLYNDAEIPISPNYPGFTKACDMLRAWCEKHLTTVYIDGRKPATPTDIKKILFGRAIAKYI
jgi:hypothetical protein